MRVPVQAPALKRTQRGQPARWSGGGSEGHGLTPSQYDGDDGDGGGEGASEGAEDENGESGEEGGNEAESSVESE
jgi:hypothetical protein